MNHAEEWLGEGAGWPRIKLGCRLFEELHIQLSVAGKIPLHSLI